MKHVSDAWMFNTRTNGAFVLLGIRVDGKVQQGTLADSALVETALRAENTGETAMNAVLLRAVQNFVRAHPHSAIDLRSPLDLSEAAASNGPLSRPRPSSPSPSSPSSSGEASCELTARRARRSES